MMELYWITRLDGIKTLCALLTIISALYAIGAGMIFFLNKKKYIFVKHSLISATTACTLICIDLFLPSTKEALLVYGLGGTIEYIKSNDKAKELPDKAIEALEMCLEIVNRNQEEERE